MTRENFSKYVRHNSRWLYRIAFRFLGNQEESEDAVQEIFLKLWNMGAKLDDYVSIDALGTTMIKNYCIDLIRKKKYNSLINDSAAEKKSNPLPDEILERAEADIIIMRIIDNLPGIYKSILIKRDIEELSYDEIAALTGQNINTLRVNLSRARAILRNEYKKYFDEKRRSGQAT